MCWIAKDCNKWKQGNNHVEKQYFYVFLILQLMRVCKLFMQMVPQEVGGSARTDLAKNNIKKTIVATTARNQMFLVDQEQVVVVLQSAQLLESRESLGPSVTASNSQWQKG